MTTLPNNPANYNLKAMLLPDDQLTPFQLFQKRKYDNILKSGTRCELENGSQRREDDERWMNNEAEKQLNEKEAE